MLGLAAATTMFRLLVGPSTLDRLVALDTLIAVTMCGVGTWAAFSLDTTVTYSLDGAGPDQLRRLGQHRPVPGPRHRSRIESPESNEMP